MKVHEKDVEKLLKGIMQDLSKAKQYSFIQWKDEKIREIQGKVEALLTIINFE